MPSKCGVAAIRVVAGLLLLVGCGLPPPSLERSDPAPAAPPASSSAPAAPSAPVSPADSTASPEREPALATLYGNGHDRHHGGAKIEVIGLERVTPTSVTARFRVSAETAQVRLEGGFHASGLAGSGIYNYIRAFSGFYLLDHPRLTAYYPMRKENTGTRDRCVCSYPEVFAKVMPGESAQLWAVYQVPPETASVAVGFHHAGLTAPLPISPAGTGARLDGEPDAGVIEAAFPTTVPLATRRTGTTSSVAESGDQVEIALNTDVLFAFDRATLTPKARETLRRTAGRIRAEAEGAVRVVGHTDDVGDGRYNQTLSLRRAKSVERALAALVPDAAFRTEGKGEAEPADPGSSEQARARNRRVEVTFERRLPTPAPATPDPQPEVTGRPGPAVSSATGLRELTGLAAELLELRRISDQALIATVDFRHVGDGGPVRLERGAWDRDLDEIGSIFGYKTDFFWLTLTGADGTRYFPLTTAGEGWRPRHCACSTIVLTKVAQGERIRLFVLMTAPPAGTTSADVNLFGFTPMKGVPVTG